MAASNLPSSDVKTSGALPVAKEASKTPRLDALEPKQQRFVREWIVDLNATQAAKRAGYSEKTARQIASQLLSKVNIAAACDELMALEAGVTRTRIVAEYAKVAFANFGDYVTFNPTTGVALVDKADLTEDQLAAVASISEATGNTDKVEIKLHDKLAALNALAKATGLMRDSAAASVNVNVQNNTTVKTGVMVLPAVATEAEWEAEGFVERQREAASKAELRAVAA